jgi:hypothetical protein
MRVVLSAHFPFLFLPELTKPFIASKAKTMPLLRLQNDPDLRI